MTKENRDILEGASREEKCFRLYKLVDNSLYFVYTFNGGESFMYATIQKWGNSQGLRIPKVLLDTFGMQENDRVELTQAEDGIRIKKVPTARHKTLEERLTTFYGKSIDEIGRINEAQEIDWGKPVGEEIW